MKTIRFCAVLLAGCAVCAVGVAVGGAGQGLQRYQIVTHSGQFAGMSLRLDRWTGESWMSFPPVTPGSTYEWRPLPVSTHPVVNIAYPVAAQAVPQPLPQPSTSNVQVVPSPTFDPSQPYQIVSPKGPPVDGAIRVHNGKMSRYNGQTGRWE